jgi:hypothetical protein
MTNVLLLPAFSVGSTFIVPNNADWLDGIFFSAPGSPTAPLQLLASLTFGNPNVVVGSTQGIVPGMPIDVSPGVPGGAFVGAIIDTQTFTMVDIARVPLNASLTDNQALLILNAVPLDLTGITFKAQVRAMAGGNDVYIVMTTADGSMVNGGADGTLLFNIPASSMQKVDAGQYVMDILAEGDGNTMNLFPQGPATVQVVEGITEP